MIKIKYKKKNLRFKIKLFKIPIKITIKHKKLLKTYKLPTNNN